MQNTNNQTNEFEIYEAIIIGIMLFFALQWTASPEAIPLFDFFPEFFSGKVVPLLITFIWIIALFNKRYFKTLIFSILSCILIVTVIRYSSNYAFRYFTIFIVGFAYVLKNSKIRERAAASSVILSALFLFSAIHKLNDYYLAGVEFETGGVFIGYLEMWFPGLIPRRLIWPMTYLPHFSILTEFIISIGLIFRPKLFVHVTGFFILILCFTNPPVLSVYFMLLPLLISISTGYMDLLLRMPFAENLKNPYFWAFYIYVSTAKIFELNSIIITNFVVVLFFLLCHFIVLMRHKNDNNLLFNYNINDFKNKKIWIIPSLMALTFLASIHYLPNPFGFKMFSGKRFENRYYTLKIHHKEACKISEKRWSLSPMTDVSWKKTSIESCEMLLPTKSSVNYVAKRLCNSFNSIIFETKSSDVLLENQLGCQNFMNYKL